MRMLKSTVLKYYGGNGAKVARALGIHRQAVHMWDRRVPLISAIKLERITNGELALDWADYDLRPKRAGKRKRNDLGRGNAAD